MSRRRDCGVDGLLLIDKPTGPTSHDIVQRVRRALGTRRVGHSGTLDPFASGLLLVALGRATRLIRFLPQSPKHYEGELRLGRSSDTDDATGEVVEHDAPLPDPERIVAAAAALVGTHHQRPPRVSARKVDGKRLYALARAGVEAEVAPREVRIDRFELTPTSDTAVWRYAAEVSAGTYVRALARDLGHALGCGALVQSLRRTAIGPISVDLACDPDDPTLDARLIALEQLPLEPPALQLDPAAAERFRHGGAVARPEDEGALRRVFSSDGALLGVGRIEGGTLRPQVVVPPRAG